MFNSKWIINSQVYIYCMPHHEMNWVVFKGKHQGTVLEESTKRQEVGDKHIYKWICACYFCTCRYVECMFVCVWLCLQVYRWMCMCENAYMESPKRYQTSSLARSFAELGVFHFQLDFYMSCEHIMWYFL